MSTPTQSRPRPAAAAATPARVVPSARRDLLVETGFAALAGALALLVAAIVLRLWDAKLHVPLSVLSGDVTDSFMVVKMLAEGSWFQNDQIGAPFGTAFEDYPFYWDLGQVLGIKALGLFSSDPAAIFNVSYVLSYPAVAVSAYVGLRWTGARRGASVLGAVLFACLPFHFLRGQAHFYIGQYWAVAISAALVFKVIAGHPLVRRRDRGGGRLTGWLSGTTLATLAAGAVSGVQFGYYAIFTLVLLVLAAVVRLLVSPRRRTLLDPAVALVTTGAGFALMLVPTLLFRAGNGTNELVASRTANEAELYGFKLSQLLLPIGDHRLGLFADKAREYAATAPPLGEGQSTPALGLLLGGAFVISFLVLVAAAFRARPVTGQGAVLRAAGIGGLLCFLLGTIGGGSSLFAYLVSPQLRGWGRISIFLAFFAAIALCAVVTWLLYDRRPGRRPLVAAAVLVGLGVLGALDQTTPATVPQYRANNDSWSSDGRFVREIEQRVPAGSMILQLPYQPFPEAPPQVRATDFDLFRPMLHSTDLRWSYGAMKGRDTDWAVLSMVGRSLSETLPEAAAAGFSGVYVDTYFYEDAGQAVLSELEAVSGQAPIRSADTRMAFVPLAPVADRVRAACPASTVRTAGQSFVRPTRTEWGAGFYPQETDGRSTWRWAGPQGRLSLEIPGGREGTVGVRFRLRGSTTAEQRVRLQVGSQPPQTIQIAPGKAAPVRLTIPADAGTVPLRMSTDAPDDGADPRDLRMQVLDLGFDDGLGCVPAT